MPYFSVRCSQGGESFAIKDRIIDCNEHFGGFAEPVLDYNALKGVVSQKLFSSRPSGMWRYRELLPVEGIPPGFENVGNSPLIKADRLARLWGMEHGKLWVKFDGALESDSLKPRVALVGIQRALELGYKKIGCVSSGNLLGTVASFGAKLGLETYIYAPSDTEKNKLAEAQVYGAKLHLFDAHFSEIASLCAAKQEEFSERGIALLNVQLRTFYRTGAKTLAFEVAEQLGGSFPRNVVIPVAAGNTLVASYQGFSEFRQLRLVNGELPSFYAAQSVACNPVSAAVKAGKSAPVDVVVSDTIARSLCISNPGDGREAIRIIRETGGWAEDVTDPEIIQAIKELGATQGIFSGTAGGTTLAVAKKLIGQGRIKPSEVTVVYVTDSGSRTPDAVPFSLENAVSLGRPGDLRGGLEGLF